LIFQSKCIATLFVFFHGILIVSEIRIKIEKPVKHYLSIDSA